MPALLAMLLVSVLSLLAGYYFAQQQAFTGKVAFYQQSLTTMYQRQAGNLPAGAVLFFGDSHIQGLAVTAVSPTAVNFGIGHQQLRQLASTLAGYPLLHQANKIVIGVGINDLLQQRTDIAASVVQLFKALQCCRQKVWLLGLLPVNETRLNMPGLSQQVLAFNEQLRQAAAHAGVQYIELYPIFADPQGQLANRFDLADGLHLNQQGYQLLIQQLTRSLPGLEPKKPWHEEQSALKKRGTDET